MNHKTFSRMGGKARSESKTRANRAKAKRYWEEVRQGKRPPPRRPKSPPAAGDLGTLLRGVCRQYGIQKLEVFGSVARGEARRGSDVDLIALFSDPPGLVFFELEDELEAILGVPVHLMTADSVDRLENPVRKTAINRDRRLIYEDGTRQAPPR